MLSLLPSRSRLCHFSAAAVTTTASTSDTAATSTPAKPREPPALLKLKSERNPDALFRLFHANATNPHLVENRFAFDDTVSRLAGAKRFDYIERLLEQQKRLPQGRREGFVVRIITLYGKAGMTQHALNTFYDMHLFRCPRTVKSFNATLMAENEGIKPDVVTYTTLMSAFYRNRRWEIGNGLWNRMVLKDCMPNLATFNVRIQFLVSMRRAWDANRLMDLMQRVGVMPDEITFNLVIKGFCQAGYIDMAQRVYDSLHGKGYKPNSKIYQTMIHHLCKCGDFSLAYTMCKDSMQKNWFPNTDTICMLLECLKGTGNIHRARVILRLAEERKPPFSSNHLATMRSILSGS